MAKFCKKCGNQLKDTSKFCSKCGTPYVDEPNSQERIIPTANVLPQAAASSVPSAVTSANSNGSSENKGSLFKYVKWVVIIGIVWIAFSAFCGKDSDQKTTVNSSSKTSTSVTNNSTVSDVRDSARFGATDKLFLGKWKRDNPNAPKDPSSITVKEANPQTGGYYVELFFYRIANAEGYAVIDGNKLSINQGSVNGRPPFRGTIEKTNNGIRLTVTESSLEYIKPGSVYEYKLLQRESGNNSTSNTQTVSASATDALVNFHKAITNKQYREAYNLLGPDMQNYVGGYDKFVRGYGTTESSKITEINIISTSDSSAKLAYMLEARDKFKAGTLVQHFSGTAKLINNGGWKISEVTAKKVGERLIQ